MRMSWGKPFTWVFFVLRVKLGAFWSGLTFCRGKGDGDGNSEGWCGGAESRSSKLLREVRTTSSKDYWWL